MAKLQKKKPAKQWKFNRSEAIKTILQKYPVKNQKPLQRLLKGYSDSFVDFLDITTSCVCCGPVMRDWLELADEPRERLAKKELHEYLLFTAKHLRQVADELAPRKRKKATKEIQQTIV
jgi:hypothetical protein